MQQLAVDVGPPGQARAVHLRGDQHAGGLGGRQQAHPARPVRGVMAGELARVHLEEGVERQVGPGLRLEQGGLGARHGGARRRVGRHRAVQQAGVGGRGGAGLAEPALVPQQEGFGDLDVVAARDRDPGGQQPGVDLGRRTPHPAGDIGPGADGLGEVRLGHGRGGGQAGAVQRGEARAAALRDGQRPAFGHMAESGTRH